MTKNNNALVLFLLNNEGNKISFTSTLEKMGIDTSTIGEAEFPSEMIVTAATTDELSNEEKADKIVEILEAYEENSWNKDYESVEDAISYAAQNFIGNLTPEMVGDDTYVALADLYENNVDLSDLRVSQVEIASGTVSYTVTNEEEV